MIEKWTERARLVGAGENVPAVVNEVFLTVLSFIDATNSHGACHSTSAMLQILLKERGIESETKIGEVIARGFRFDHSWIEIDGAIYDAAVAYPDPQGEHVGGPVFCGIDLDAYAPLTNRYGFGAAGGLNPPASEISLLSFGAYFAYADNDNIMHAVFNGEPKPIPLWHLVAAVGETCGVHKTAEQLAGSHFETRRQVVYSAD